MKNETLFPKGLFYFTAIVLLIFFIGVIVFLRVNHQFLREINEFHFSMLERNSINVRLSEKLSLMRSGLLVSKKAKEDIIAYRDVVSTLEQNLLDTEMLLKNHKGVSVKLLAARQKEKQLEDEFLTFIMMQKVAEARKLYTSEAFGSASESGIMSLFDYAEESSIDRDLFLEKLNKFSLMVILSTVLVIFLCIGLSYRILKVFKINLKRRDELQNQLSLERDRASHQNRLAALGEMAAGVAHEVNNPLTIFNLHLRTIEKSLRKIDGVDDKIFENIEKSKQNVERIAKIISGLKLFSRDGSHDEMTLFALRDLISESIEITQAKQLKVGVTVKVEDFRIDLKIVGRIVQLSQVLMNLISNGLDAVEELEEKWVKISVTELNQFVKIAVTDSGKGISKEIVNKILDPFFTTKGVNKGTGLGLSLSLEMIKQHNGKLYYNENSENTQFIIELPINQESVLL